MESEVAVERHLEERGRMRVMWCFRKHEDRDRIRRESRLRRGREIGRNSVEGQTQLGAREAPVRV